MTPRPRRLRLHPIAAVLLLFAPGAVATAAEPFYLKDGDRVVFYGDSITDQRLYTTFVETYVVTRFPKRDVTFVHSGWGGDRVTGGGGGPVDRRIERDVVAYRPTVVTVMLGMNDGSYRAYDPKIFDRYAKGYEHLVETLRSKLPGVRITLIRPSPYDDVTRKPSFKNGYNSVLVTYGEFLQELAEKNGLDVADLNAPVVRATENAFETDPTRAQRLNPDRIHPGPAGQLLMAEALLKAWHAPALVSRVAVKVDGEKASSEATQAEVTDLAVKDGAMTWTQLDEALPFPIDLKDSVVALAVRSSDVVHALDRQPLKVEGLKPGRYTLKIDGKTVGTYDRDRLARGLNLALEPTPMAAQAADVHKLTLKHTGIHQLRWRQVQVPLQSEDPELVKPALDALDKLEAKIVRDQRAAAEPKSRHFELSPATEEKD